MPVCGENLNLRFVFVPQIEPRNVRPTDVPELFRIKLSKLRYKIHTFGTLASRDGLEVVKRGRACNDRYGTAWHGTEIKFDDQGLVKTFFWMG